MLGRFAKKADDLLAKAEKSLTVVLMCFLLVAID